MRAVIQRVTESNVSVDGKVSGSIGAGLVALLGVEEEDTIKDAEYIAQKISGLRIFEDADEKMNLSVKDVDGKILMISQFTLMGDVRKGKRPSFSHAAKPEIANKLYKETISLVKKEGILVEEGVFQADMLVKIYNDGPVTILLDSKKTF
ncbi:MAG: D-aminoacyl-tRNA deacylase [Anaerovoracaceae bacterium]